MPLTTAQLAALRADIAADPVLSLLPVEGDGSYIIADAYNLPAVPEARVWDVAVPVRAIMDTFNWAAFTPTDTVPESNVDQASLQRFLSRMLVIQTKQMNLQLMLQGRDTVDASLANFRAGLRDALVSIPSGVNGAAVNGAGGSATNALNACTRPATRAERLFATSQQTTGSVTAWVMGNVGPISYADVAQARAN
jgi:hypothetical protein